MVERITSSMGSSCNKLMCISFMLCNKSLRTMAIKGEVKVLLAGEKRRKGERKEILVERWIE